MNFNEVKTTAVVGAGNIGHGIASRWAWPATRYVLIPPTMRASKRVWISSRQTWIDWWGWI